MTPTEQAQADYKAGKNDNPFTRGSFEWGEYQNKIEALFDAEFMGQQNKCPTCEE